MRPVSLLTLTALFATLALTGCAVTDATFESSGPTSAGSYTIHGVVEPSLNGEATAATRTGLRADNSQPVAGSKVYLYAAGTGGYGSTAQLLAMTTTSTDGLGSFSFTQDPNHTNSLSSISNTYSCPSYTFRSPDRTSTITRDSYVYIVAVGGDPADNGATTRNNGGLTLMAALGDCQTLAQNPPKVSLNEISTVASTYALAPYISPIYPSATVNGAGITLPGGALGTSTAYMTAYGSEVQGGYTKTGSRKSNATSPLGYIGMGNAFSTVARLADTSKGQSVTTFKSSGLTYSGLLTVTGTPEYAKLNTIADILAACVNTVDNKQPGGSSTRSANCSLLFTYAAPPVSSASTSLGTGVTLPSATDTLQATYYMATNPTDNLTYGADTHPSTSNLGKLYALVSSSAPFQPTLAAQPTDWTLSIAYNSNAVCNSNSSTPTRLLITPNSIATDLAGNIAVVNGPEGNMIVNGNSTALGSAIAQLGPDGTPAQCIRGSNTALGSALYDTSGDLWTTDFTSNAYEVIGTNVSLWTTVNTKYAYSGTKIQQMTGGGDGSIYFSGTYAANANFTQGVVGAFNNAANSSPVPATVYLETNNNEAGTATTITASGSLSQIFAGFQDGQWLKGNANGGSGGTFGFGVSSSAPDAFGDVYLGSNTIACCNNYVTLYNPATDKTAQSGAALGGQTSDAAMTTDGAGNVWIANGTAELTDSSGQTNGIFGITELDGSLNALSPTGTGKCSSATGCSQNGGFQKSAFGPANSLVVDISGNLWVAVFGAPGSYNGTSPTYNPIVEIIGTAVPTVQPLSLAVRDTTSATLP